jgi:hypothetical protein
MEKEGESAALFPGGKHKHRSTGSAVMLSLRASRSAFLGVLVIMAKETTASAAWVYVRFLIDFFQVRSVRVSCLCVTAYISPQESAQYAHKHTHTPPSHV